MTEPAFAEARRWEPTEDVIAAEEQVLGAALAAPIVDDLALEPEDFYRSAHRHVWSAIRALTDRGDPVDVASVTRELQAEVDGARSIGAVHELVLRLYAGLITASNADYHAGTVREAARLRRLYEAGVYLQQLASTPGDVDGKLDRARDRLAAVESVAAAASMRPVADSLTETLEALEADVAPGLTTGLVDLDLALAPMTAGQLLIVAARPGMGKSLVLLTIARNVAQVVADTGGVVAFFSLEMSRDEVNQRLIASTGVALSDLRPPMADHAWTKAAAALGTLSDLPLHVNDSADVTLADLRAYCRRERRLRLLVVDYLQLMGTSKAENRQNEVATLSRGLKLLGKAAGVPVMVAAQLNRSPEHRQSKRPMLADLRESGAIEQDADGVLLLHRDEYYDPTQRPSELDVIVAKQRNGPTSEVTLGFQGAYSRIVNLSRKWQ